MADEQVPQKRGRGRPKGSKDLKPRKPREDRLVDPKTGMVIRKTKGNSVILGRMGDEKVTAFVQYHTEMLKMRQGCDKKNVPDLYARFLKYLEYCAEHGILPNNMNAYFAIGLVKQDIYEWKNGMRGTPEHKKFAEDLTQFFASIHEQAGGEGVVNPILSIYWSKAHDGMVEASKVEVINSDPLGEKRSAEDIMNRYKEVELPE